MRHFGMPAINQGAFWNTGFAGERHHRLWSTTVPEPIIVPAIKGRCFAAWETRRASEEGCVLCRERIDQRRRSYNSTRKAWVNEPIFPVIAPSFHPA